MRRLETVRKMAAKITDPLQIYSLDVSNFRYKFGSKSKDCSATLVVVGAGTKDEEIVGLGIRHFRDTIIEFPREEPYDPMVSDVIVKDDCSNLINLFLPKEPVLWGTEIFLVEFPKMKKSIDLDSLPDYFNLDVDTFVNNIDEISKGLW